MNICHFLRLIATTLSGLLFAQSAQAVMAACPSIPVDLVAVSDGIWSRPANAHDPASWTEPVTVWVGDNALWIADPGPHRCAGLALRQALTLRWPGHRHRLINTHAHPRNVLANSGWPPGTPIYALGAVKQQMRRRCPVCLSNLRQELGPRWMQGTTIRLPNRQLMPGVWMKLGAARWQILHHTQAHTEADTSFHSPELKLVVAHSLLSWGKLPDLTRSDPEAWIRSMDRLDQLAPGFRWLGHRTASEARQDFSTTRAYLETMHQSIRKAIAQGRSEHEFHDSPSLASTGSGVDRDRRQHLLNVQHVWRLLEQQELGPPGRLDP